MFGAWIIPKTTQFLILHALDDWIIILIVCLVLPLIALTILWLVIQEIQAHFNISDKIIDKDINEDHLMKAAFTEEDEKFIEIKMKEQLDQHEFEDEDVFELSKDLILTYVNSRLRKSKAIPLNNISKELEIPHEVVKDIVLLLIADNQIDGMLEKDVIISSE